MGHKVKPAKRSSSLKKEKKYHPDSLIGRLKKRRTIETLAAFIAGGWLVLEFVHWILIDHYHFPERTLDITFITLICALLCTLTWRWFRGIKKPRKIKAEFILVPIFVFITAFLDLRLFMQMGKHEEQPTYEVKWEKSLAVISFENQTDDNSYDYLQKAIPNLLITNLEQAGYFYVMTWERMHDLLRQMGKEDVEIIDGDLGFELCHREGIETIAVGSFIKMGDLFATDVKILDVETKSILKSVNSKGRGVESILETQIDDLSRGIFQGIGIIEEKTTQLKASDIITGSIDAYKNYLRGNDAFWNFYYAEACRFYERAVEFDSSFASAYLYLAFSHYLLGDLKAGDEALMKAMVLRESATEKERLLIESWYAGQIEGNYEKTINLLQQLAKKYPKEKIVFFYLGFLYRFRDPDKAIEEFKRALDLDPDFGMALNLLGYTYTDIGDFEKAIEQLKKYVSLNPGEPGPLDSLAEAYFRWGRLEEAIAKYKEALEIKPDFYLSLMPMSYVYALKEKYTEAIRAIENYIDTAPSSSLKADGYLMHGFYHYWLGSLEKSLRYLQRAEDMAEAVEDEMSKTSVSWIKLWIYYDRGEFELSREYNESVFDVWTKNYPGSKLWYKYYSSGILGLIDLREGLIDSAKTRLSEMKSVFSELTSSRKEEATFLYNLFHAEVLLAEDSPEKAISVFEKAPPLGPPSLQYLDAIVSYNAPFLQDVLPRAYEQKSDLDKAIAEYERLITFDPENRCRQLFHPKYHYRLAKLYEKKGWEGKAIEHYETFLGLWKDADPGIAEVEDAEKRLSGLR
jgi:tetratricopeptide (TPR) repeat protein